METAQQELLPDIDVTQLTPHKFAPKGAADKIRAIKQQYPNLGPTMIAKLTGCTHGNVSQVLSRFALEQQEIEDYKDTRADIYAGKQAQILKLKLTEDEIKKMNGAAAALWFNSLFNNERLTRGQSTNNIDAHLMLRNDQTLDSKLQELQALVDNL